MNILELPIPTKPEDIIHECNCGCQKVWITAGGFQCCNCEMIVKFGDLEPFDGS